MGKTEVAAVDARSYPVDDRLSLPEGDCPRRRGGVSPDSRKGHQIFHPLRHLSPALDARGQGVQCCGATSQAQRVDNPRDSAFSSLGQGLRGRPSRDEVLVDPSYGLTARPLQKDFSHEYLEWSGPRPPREVPSVRAAPRKKAANEGSLVPQPSCLIAFPRRIEAAGSGHLTEDRISHGRWSIQHEF